MDVKAEKIIFIILLHVQGELLGHNLCLSNVWPLGSQKPNII